MAYPETIAEVLKIIAETKFSPFTQADWYAFSGCESNNPVIGEYNDMAVIIDGNNVLLLQEDDEYGGKNYSLVSNS